MTLERYYHDVVMTMLDNPTWRYGQALFNVLAEVRMDLVPKVVGTPADPYHASSHDDGRIINFHNFLTEQW